MSRAISARLRLTLTAGLATALTAWSLRPAFAGLRWLGYALGAIAVVATAGAVSRRLRLPPALHPLIELVALTLLVAALFGRDTTLLGLLPGPGTPGVLADGVHSGFVDIQQLAAPVRATPGLLLVTTGGVGLVAVAVDTLAVTAARAAPAGLPLLALFAVPAAVVDGGVGAFGFALGAVGWLTLLLAEGRERVGRWGRPVRAAAPAAPAAPGARGGAPLAALGRRIGAAALGVAVVLPALVPGLAGRPFGHGSGLLGGGSGGSSVTTYNPIAALHGELTQPDPKPLLTVRTNDPAPGYLRMTVLDRFDGSTWSQEPLTAPSSQRVDEALPPPLGLAEATPRRTVRSTIVAARDFKVPWLPAYFPVSAVDVAGDWRYDGVTRTIFSTHTDTRGLTYRLTTTLPTPSARQLADLPQVSYPTEIALRDLDVPADLPAPVSALVAQITAGAGTPYDKAAAIQAYFRGPAFHYDVNVPQGNSSNALVNFLQVKRGFCEQYAAAMALMARVAGIPARVAIGFTRGTRQPDGDWLITTSDAHAWPELYFPGVGWLRFEPTPRADGTAATPAYTQGAPASPTGPGAPTPASSDTPTDPGTAAGPSRAESKQADLDHADNRVGAAVPVAPAPADGQPIPARLLAAVLLVVLALISPATARFLAHRRRRLRPGSPVAAAHAAWAQMLDDAADLGYPRQRSDTPRAAAARLVAAGRLAGPAATALHALALAEEHARYARSMPAVGDLTGQLRAVRHGLRAGVPAIRRWRARLLPTAALRQATARVGDLLADVVDRADGALARLPRRS